jgi:predicted nucleic acid-binding protein
MSEMTRAIDYYERQAADLRTTQDDREGAARRALRLGRVHELHETGMLVVTDMTDEEWAVAAALTNPSRADEFGLRFPLHSGEAACVAIATERGWIVASDDSDALKALRHLGSSPGYERIRKLLIRGAREKLITKKFANAIHAEMRALGFWDLQPPFT